MVVKQADVIVVNASVKVGAGTAHEMVVAKYFRKPVVSVIPPDSHHRKSKVVFHKVEVTDWMHPFLWLSSDYIAGSINDAAHWVEEYAKGRHDGIKGFDVFKKAIKRFEDDLSEMRRQYEEELK